MLRILVVDPRPEICEVIAFYLRESGHLVASHSNGHAALMDLSLRPFDALLVDAGIPGLSGPDLAEIAAARGMAVIVFSGEPSAIAKHEEERRHVFLRKPFRLQLLDATLRHALKESRRAHDPVTVL